MTTEIVVTEKSVESEPPISTTTDPAPLAEAAVEVARIEGETQIALAENDAETSVARVRAIEEVNAEHEEHNEWQRSIEGQMAELREMQASILSRLTPAEPSPPSPPSEGEVVPPEAESPQTEVTESPARANKRRWI